MSVQIITKIIVIALLFLVVSVVYAQDYTLIIAPNDFLEELDPLVRFKKASSRPTYIMGLDAIRLNYTGVDDPEKIKKCIWSYYNTYGIGLVLLVGDCDKMPVRYCRAINTEWGSKYYPSDLYYADILNASGGFDNWDGDGDGIFGEMDFLGQGTPDDVTKVNLDSIHMIPEVGVARVPASTDQEVITYVNKVIRYETKAPGNWYNEALLVVDGGTSPFGDEGAMDTVVPYLSRLTITKRYQDVAPWSTMTDAQRSAEINNVLNGGVGLVNYYGHGNRDQWTNWYNTSYMTSLTNTTELPVIYAHSCYTARFHTDLEYYWTANNAEWNRLSIWPRPARLPTIRSLPLCSRLNMIHLASNQWPKSSW